MVLTQDMISQVFRTIETRNGMLTSQAIIHSDELISQLSAQMGVTKDVIQRIVHILLESHRILHIDIIASDDARGVDKIEGYVVADMSNIRSLKNYYDSQLMILYEKQYHRARGATSIIKELFPQIRTLNTSEIGQILNKAMMLGEYENLIEKDYREYSHSWQEKRMSELAKENGFAYKSDLEEYCVAVPKRHATADHREQETATSEISGKGQADSTDAEAAEHKWKRAVDTEQYHDFSDKKNKYPLKRLLSIYGVEFFTKIYFRKYEFDYIRQIIDDHQITSRNELLTIKNLLAVVKKNTHTDLKLNDYREQIYELERAITHAVFYTNSLKM